MSIFRLIPAVSLLGALAGCGNSDYNNWFSYRNGPDPVIDPVQVQKSIATQNDIIKNLEDINKDKFGNVNYYNVTVTGFNFVDEQCDAYMRELYTLDHERDRFKGAITATGLLTNAIMGAEPASKVSMAIVTQAFGLSGELLDTLTDSYLFKSHSSDIFTVVEKLQATYRQ